MNFKKVKMRKSKSDIFYPGDLLFYKIRMCEITILGYDPFLGAYQVLFHDTEAIVKLSEHMVIKYCYHIS